MSDRYTKAVIYCRVSSTKQATEGHGLDSQEMRCREYAANREYAVDAVFTDDVSGGGDFMKRPGMVRLLNFLDQHPEESYVVIFDDLKRFSRDTIFHLKLSQEMSLRNAKRECLNFKFEDSPEGEFIETVIAAQGQLERQQNSRQVRQKMKARLLNGYYCFPAPPGYHFAKVGDHGKMLVRKEPLASVLQEGLEGFASGRFETQGELLRFFDRCPDFPRGSNGKIHFQRIKEVLTCLIYAGYLEKPDWGITARPAKHEGLICYATFLKNQERLNQKAKAPARKDMSIHFPLRNFVLCGDCGGALTSTMSKGRNGYHPYYMCHRKGCGSYGKSIRRDVMEREFSDIVSSMQPSSESVEVAEKMFRMAWDYRKHNAKELVASARQEIAGVERNVEQLMDRIVKTSSPSVISAYEKRIESMEKQKRIWEEKLLQTSQPVHSFDDTFRTALLFLSNPQKIWLDGEFEQKRMLLRMAFTDKLTYIRNQGFRTAAIALPFSLMREIANDNSEMVRSRGLEPPPDCSDNDLNVARLPIPPRAHIQTGIEM